jgi:hypothetical protein
MCSGTVGYKSCSWRRIKLERRLDCTNIMLKWLAVAGSLQKLHTAACG